MATSMERSRDIQMKSCEVIGHVTALDPSEPSTRLTRSAPGDNITAKQCLGGDNRDDTLRHLATVSPQKGVIYANLYKFIQMSCDVSGHVTALDQSDQSKLGHKPSTQLTRSAPW